MNDMQPCPDNAFDWIRTGREEVLASDNPNWKGNFVSHLLPKSFEAYAKLLHSIEANYKNIDNPLTEREISVLPTPTCTRLRSFVERLRKETEDLELGGENWLGFLLCRLRRKFVMNGSEQA